MTSRSTELNIFFKLKTQIKMIGAHILFLQKCKQNSVFPKFMKLHISNNCKNSVDIIRFAKQKWLSSEIKQHYTKRSKLEMKCYGLHLALTKNLNNFEFVEWLTFVNKMHEVINYKFSNKIKKQQSKLNKLVFENKSKCNKSIIQIQENIVENHSSENFNTNEIKLLNKGLKYAVKNKEPPLEDLIVSIETGIKHLDNDSKDFVRNACKINLLKNRDFLKHKTIHLEEHKIIKDLKKRDVFYLKADKGNKIVILDKSDYYNRVNNLLMNGSYKLITKNPLPKMISEVNSIFKKCPTLITKSLNLKLKSSNPVVPKLYCLPKIHKPGSSVRPIVSGINSPTYSLSKWLVNEFSNLPNQPETLAVENSLKFIDKVKNIKLNTNEILVSFDVVSLFPSIPISKTLEFLKIFLENNFLDTNKINEYLLLTELCMSQNYFQFNDKFYNQSEGTVMGNSLSPFLANLFMSNFEVDLQTKNKNFPRIWVRYVDDIFAIFDTEKYNINDFLNKLNGVFPSIKFTYEKEIDNKLPFLDVLVIKNKDKLEFDIYRKPTNTNRFITNDSNHFFQHKIAAFNFLINRLTKFPLNKVRYNRELKLILEIAKFNGFPTSTIYKIVNKFKHKQFIDQNTTLSTNNTKSKKYISLPFDNITKGLNKIFQSQKLNIAYKSNNTLKSMLGNPKDKIDNNKKSGIYQISCNDCDKIYIGQTKRKIETRFKEHIYCLKSGNPDKSSVAQHMFDNNHSINLNNLKLIKNVNNFWFLNAYESLNIHKFKKQILNSDLGPIPYSKLFSLIPEVGVSK